MGSHREIRSRKRLRVILPAVAVTAMLSHASHGYTYLASNTFDLITGGFGTGGYAVNGPQVDGIGGFAGFLAYSPTPVLTANIPYINGLGRHPSCRIYRFIQPVGDVLERVQSDRPRHDAERQPN